MTTAYCTLQKHSFTWLVPSMHSKESHIHMPTAINALYRNTHSQAHWILHSIDAHIPMPTAVLHSTDTHSYSHCCPALCRDTHSHSYCLLHSSQAQFTCRLCSALCRNIHSNANCHHLILKKHIFTCPQLSCTLHTKIFTCLLPSLQSTEAHNHMHTVIFQSTETHFPMSIAPLHSTETFICPLHTSLFSPIYTYAWSYTAFYRNIHSYGHYQLALYSCLLLCWIWQKHMFTCHCLLHCIETNIHMSIEYTFPHSTETHDHMLNKYCPLQKHKFLCQMLSWTQQKHTFTYPLPSLHSTVTSNHMPTSVLFSKEKHIHIITGYYTLQ